jgi:hypothetical protein
VPVRGGQLILLLPERRRFAGQPVSASVGGLLARADRLPDSDAGEREQLLRYFQLHPAGWPMAAIARQAMHGDAAGHVWLRADPVFLQPDMTGARLMAWGNLGLSVEESGAFLDALRPLFEGAGFPIFASGFDGWSLKLPKDIRLPEFASPADAMGEDLLAHLPQGPEGRTWRVLLNEAQVILHNHPLNAGRLSTGKLPVNSLWFWGGGVLPDSLSCNVGSVISDDLELTALAKLSGASLQLQETGSALIDLRRARDWPTLERKQIEPALTALKRHHATVILDFADGARWLIAPRRQRWRLLRRSLTRLDQ